MPTPHQLDRRSRRVRPVAAALATLAAFSSLGMASAGEGSPSVLPRYAFTPGDHLVYEGDETAETTGGSIGYIRRTELRAVGAKEDGSRRVVVTQSQSMFVVRNGERTEHPARESLYIVDLALDGRSPQRDLDTFDVVNRVLPVLPATEAEAAKGWSFTGGDVEHRCSPVADDDARHEGEERLYRFTLVPSSATWTVLGFSATYGYEFDLARGCIKSIAVQHRHKDRDTRRGTERLIDAVRLAEGEAESLDRESGAYLEAERIYEERLSLALGALPPPEAKALLEQAGTDLNAAVASLESPLLRTHLARLAGSHRAALPQYLAQVDAQSRLVGQGAPEWTLRDLAGETHRLTDYRGRVIVMDFWERNCQWCIRAMPQIQSIAHRFADRPVTVLGMNVDQVEADARFVVDLVGPAYPTVMAGKETAALYGVRAYPTVMVIDGEGIIRRVHTGHSPTLAAELAREVEELLAAGAGAR